MCSIAVSTEDQAREGFSLPEQEKRLRAMCEYKGMKYIKYIKILVLVLKLVILDLDLKNYFKI